MPMLKKYLLFLGVIVVTASAFFYRASFQFLKEPLAIGRGVVFYDRLRTQSGYTLIEVFSVPWGRPRCRVMDFYGQVVFTLPGINCELLQDGGFVSNMERTLTRYDQNLQVKWAIPDLIVRHDIYENVQTKEILLWVDVHSKVNANMPFSNSKDYLGKTLLVNELRGYDENGKMSFRWNAFEHLEDLQEIKNNRETLLKLTLEYKENYEFSHFNSIDVIPKNTLEKKWSAFKKGNILTSSTTCGCIAIIDRQSGAIVWHHRTPIATGLRTSHPDNYRTHSAHWLKNGHILFFVNSRDDDASTELFSEVIELDPVTHKVVWSYKAQTSGRFWGNYLGSSYRLENGNTLMTSLANGGNIFEISRDGRLVWEWSNSTESPIFPGSIYRARRISEKTVDALRTIPRPEFASGVPDPFFEP